MNFSEQDLADIRSRSISTTTVEQQIADFQNGFPYLPTLRAAVIGDGIVRLSAEQALELATKWDSVVSQGDKVVEKFVPASGAATRMFKEYFEFVGGSPISTAVEKSVANITNFAFYDDLVAMGIDLSDARAVVSAIIGKGLEYGIKPKALLKFHKYSDGGRTSCEEHLVESALYALSSDGAAKIHFTISAEHRAGFEAVIATHKSSYEERYGVKYQISYSEQKPATDTIAVDLNNEPFRLDSGKLLFRPAGHGALIENLNDIVADVVFIKTVDNVVPDHRKTDTILYKRALAAIGIELQERVFGYLRAMDSGDFCAAQVREFIESSFGYSFAPGELTIEQLRAVLARPIRVCAMVRNEGEPGGGPFWVQGDDGSISVQIAESSQISPEQSVLFSSATHFNPVDLVCFPMDYRGEKYDLLKFVDPTTGFISKKSHAGRELKSIELPGLWNGAMANWNTVFVEVPITTFAPVKVLTDLLREEHQ